MVTVVQITALLAGAILGNTTALKKHEKYVFLFFV